MQDSKDGAYRVTVSLTKADGDIIKFIEFLKKGNKTSKFIREAIREKMNEDAKTKNEIDNITELRDRVKTLEKTIKEVGTLAQPLPQYQIQQPYQNRNPYEHTGMSHPEQNYPQMPQYNNYNQSQGFHPEPSQKNNNYEESSDNSGSELQTLADFYK